MYATKVKVSQRHRKETMVKSIEEKENGNDARVGQKALGEMNHLELVLALRKYIHVSMYRATIRRDTESLRTLLAYYEKPMLTPEEEAELTYDKRREEADQRDESFRE